MGRPSEFIQSVADEICIKIATSNKGIYRICADNEQFPDKSTIFRWLADPKYKEFQDQYACAKRAQAEFLAEEMIEIADDSSNDTMTIRKGNIEIEVENKEWVNRSRLKVDTRKWIASKLFPKKYGDKTDITSGDQPIQNNISLEALALIAQKLNAKKEE